MQQVLGLKAVGTVSIRFSNSPITRDQGGLIAGTHRNDCPIVGAVMFLILILGALAWGAYQFFKYNTNSGAETLRAYIYLEALLRGDGRETAQSLVSGNMIDLDTEVMQHIVNEIRIVHAGRQLPLVAEAYRQGMSSRMPGWYRWSASQCDPTISVFAVYTSPLTMKEKEPDWVQSFVTYFVLGELKGEPEGEIPGTVLMPDNLVTLLEGDFPDYYKFSIPASLRNYMAFAFPATTQFRSDFLHTEIRDYLTKTLRLLGQPGTMRQMLQKQHTQISGSPMTETELDELTAGMKQRQAEGVDVVQMMYGMGLLSITEDEFRARHDKSYEQFEAEMVAFNNRPDRNDTDSEAIIPNHDAIQRNTSRSIQS
ncbi:hypothetical protein [Agrobacterium sp. ICMP 6402]|uniref:hypothetical protein n=1 Tax=Agrobacterium sp. ICMP 6402 TaxID=2292443 RepID=UPI00129669CB|nr:hypothetical protein [Agrobacterium sp. ICMP 6402]